MKSACFLLIISGLSLIQLCFKKENLFRLSDGLLQLCDILISMLGGGTRLRFIDGAGLFCTSLWSLGKLLGQKVAGIQSADLLLWSLQGAQGRFDRVLDCSPW